MDTVLIAIQKSYIEPQALEAALLLGRAGTYVHEQALDIDPTSARGQIYIHDLWQAAQLLFSLRELVRECGRRYCR